MRRLRRSQCVHAKGPAIIVSTGACKRRQSLSVHPDKLENSFHRGARVKSRVVNNVAGALLGLCFVASSVPVLFHLVPIPDMPAGTPIAHFMEAFVPTGYMTFVKLCELGGGILVAIPRTRNFGLLVLGPIIVNIIVFHLCVTTPKNLIDPMLDVMIVLALYSLWAGRKQFAGLLN
jgi:putative oxidoreductase